MTDLLALPETHWPAIVAGLAVFTVAVASPGPARSASWQRPGARSGGTPVLFITPTVCLVIGAFVFQGYALIFASPFMMAAYRRARRAIEGMLAAIFGYADWRLSSPLYSVANCPASQPRIARFRVSPQW